MSQMARESVTCPNCGAVEERPVLRSLSGDRAPPQVAAILAGTFEAMACTKCGHEFQPEHRMLYACVPKGTWIVMHPRDEQGRFATLEHGVQVLFEREMAGAPAPLKPHLDGLRPRLVFGQHLLSEAVRQSELGMDPAIVECAKLLLYRRHMVRLVPHGPIELCYEGAPPAATLDGKAQDQPDDTMLFGIHALATGERIADLTVAPDILDEAVAGREDFQSRHPELFSQPYISATRYLFGARA